MARGSDTSCHVLLLKAAIFFMDNSSCSGR